MLTFFPNTTLPYCNVVATRSLYPHPNPALNRGLQHDGRQVSTWQSFYERVDNSELFAGLQTTFSEERQPKRQMRSMRIQQ